MKRSLQIFTIAAAASWLPFTAPAQETPNLKTDRPDYGRNRIPHERRGGQLHDVTKASDVIGMTVKNYQDEKLGKVEDLGMDVESGRIVQVIISTGGFIGIGDTLSAVPPGALHHDVAHKVLHLDANKEKLRSAPKFEMSKWAECCDSNHLSEVYRHYGEEPAFRFIGKERAPNTVSTRKADGTWDKDRISSDSQSMIPVSRLSHVQKASKIMGSSVKNLQDEKLGKVENILLDLPSGRVVAVLVSSGGFLGMGDELSAIPPTALRFTTDRDTLQLDASKEMLSNAPRFKANEWPDFGQPSYSHGVYRAYGVEPYFSTNAVAASDNTAQNVRDRKDGGLTPFNQGNSPADRDTTTQIRKEILAGKDLSVNARNVKIITIDGRVTLRGPVNTEAEKRLIGEIAARIAQPENVNNQLEVKLTPTGNN